MKKDDESIAEEIEVARRELLHVQAAMEEIAGSGNAHRVGESLQVCGSKDRLLSSSAICLIFMRVLLAPNCLHAYE